MLKTVFFFGLLSCCLAEADNDDQSEVQLAFVILRHGERVPEVNEQFPTDSYKIEDFYPNGWGQLTNAGKQKMYLLGKVLRQRYDEFLGEVYSSEIADVHSTDWDRTKMSAQLVMAGLFPPPPIQQWDENLRWIPIPYKSKPFDSDYFLRRPDFYCPSYMEELGNVFASEPSHKVLIKYKKLFQHITNSTGINITKVGDVFNIYQNINSKEELNLTIPEWAKHIYPEPLHRIAAFQCLFENFNSKLIRLNGGHFMKTILRHCEDKINGTLVPQGRKIYVYSAHENNIVHVLAFLNVYEQHLPRYGSYVLLELHRIQSTNEYGLKVFYNDGKSPEIRNLPIPNCGSFCHFDKLMENSKVYIPQNYTEECASNINLEADLF